MLSESRNGENEGVEFGVETFRREEIGGKISRISGHFSINRN